ncbi:hypothetical protein AMECASPLE_025630 [Ameca splendens]|uniref:Receptor ligand binding region domain-containing protein n=1 Tax=Ameca splendens TaxID=208324 RepID=A0ABV0ZQY3_9TELE
MEPTPQETVRNDDWEAVLSCKVVRVALEHGKKVAVEGGLISPRTVITCLSIQDALEVEEINNSTKLLPGIRLGYQIYDTCSAVPVAVHVAFQLSNGQDPMFYKGSNCSQTGVVIAVVGDSGSTLSISMARIIGSFNIPLVSHFATCACLSDKREYPTFFRTIPSDHYQAAALAKLVKHFGWT